MSKEFRQFAAVQNVDHLDLTVPVGEVWLVYRGRLAAMGDAGATYSVVVDTSTGAIQFGAIVDDGSQTMSIEFGSLLLFPGDVLHLVGGLLIGGSTNLSGYVSGVAYVTP